MTSSYGPFGRFFQIGYVTRDIDKGCALLRDRMGAQQIDLIEEFRDGEGNQMMIRSLAHLSLGDVEIEIIEPRVGWDSIYVEALPGEGDPTPTLHHLGYRLPDVASWEAAMEGLKASGMTVALDGAASRVRFAYLDTRGEVGHYTEVVYRGYN